MSGPSRAALKHGVRTLGAGHEASLGVEAIERAHDPDLGLDRSVCLREIVDALSMQACRTQMGAPAAEYIERQFTPERRNEAS